MTIGAQLLRICAERVKLIRLAYAEDSGSGSRRSNSWKGICHFAPELP